MSLLQQDNKNASNGNNVDPMQFQHQQLMSQFQRTVSSTVFCLGKFENFFQEIAKFLINDVILTLKTYVATIFGQV